jgi:outer membrane protein assembly factor BamE (lipoprotein component of BamABCDE complex)
MKMAKKAAAILCIAFVSSTLINAIRYRYSLTDALLRTIFFIFEDTRWAKDYTEEGFDRLTIGMTTEEATQILGEPLRKNCSNTCVWVYTWQQASTLDFDQRSLVFDENMRLKEKIRGYFID